MLPRSIQDANRNIACASQRRVSSKMEGHDVGHPYKIAIPIKSSYRARRPSGDLRRGRGLVGAACMDSIAEKRLGRRRGDWTDPGRLDNDIVSNQTLRPHAA